MQIAELTAFHVRIPLRRVIRHASHTRMTTDNVIVRCRLADGVVGWGEGVPRDYVTGETVESALAVYPRSRLAGQLEPCRDLAAAVAMAERLHLATAADDDRAIGANAARCALELAILDAYARHFGQPLSAVTEIAAPALVEKRAIVQYSGAIASADGFKLKLIAWAYRWVGFRQIKVKVGMPNHDDRKRLQTIRRRVGVGVELRVDANEAWSPDEAVERIRELESCGIACVEQPIAHANVQAFAQLRRAVTAPIMLDESLCGLTDAERAVQGQWCDRFNLRLSKCGGFLPTLRLAEFARRHGIGAQLGCQVGETAILSAAGRHLAASVGGLTAVEGSFDRHLVRTPLGDRDITFGRRGLAPSLPGPGLGIAINPAALAKVTVREERLIG